MARADFWQTFLRFGLESLQFLTVGPLLVVLLICVTGVIIAGALQRPFQAGVWRPWYWLIFTQLLLFPAIVSVGILFHASGIPTPRPSLAGQQLLDALFYLSVTTGAFWVYRLKGARWVALSLIALQELILLGAGVISGMSVTGDWL